MLEEIINKFKTINTSALINLTDILMDMGYVKYPTAFKHETADMIISELRNETTLHIVYTGYRNFYIVIVDSDLHLRKVNLAMRTVYKKFIPFIKGENYNNYKQMLAEINRLRLVKDKYDEIKTEVLHFKHYNKDIFGNNEDDNETDIVDS